MRSCLATIGEYLLPRRCGSGQHRARRQCATLVVGFALIAPTAWSPAGADEGPSAGLSVSGNQLLQGGRPFIPRGFVMRGLMDNTAVRGGCRANDGLHSPDSVFNPVSWPRIRDDWHANTVRIHVSQSGLWGAGHRDKRGHGITDAMAESYADLIERQITAVTAQGLVVILSMQDQHQSCGWSDALPSDATQAAWDRLLRRDNPRSIRRNGNVMLNLFNEPAHQPTPSGWRQWAYGGDGPVPVSGCDKARVCNHGRRVIGHQDLVQSIRQAGVPNVIVVDGANKAGRLTGLLPDYRISDEPPGRGIVYDVHPFYFTDGPVGWQSRFGYAVDPAGPNVAVIAGAWNFFASECSAAPAGLAPAVLGYLRDRGIGVIAYAWDDRIGNGVVKNWDGAANTGTCRAPYASRSLPGSVFQGYLDSFG